MAVSSTKRRRKMVATPRAVPDVETGLSRLRQQIEQDDVKGARALVAELQERWPESSSVRHWARVLAPGEARLAPEVALRSFDREFKWLRQHRREYPGCWLAVHGDRLVVADPSLARVYEEVRESVGDEPVLIHFEGPHTP